MRTMYDSTEANDIPLTAEMVAGYLPPSSYAWSAADWARFPHAIKVRIAIFASVPDGHVLDVERGDATPAQAPGWVRMRRAAGVDPTIYCNASTWPTVRQAFRDQGVAEPHYWIAKYDGVDELIPGAVAKQYANPPVHGRGHFDLSVVADYWPGVDQAGPPPPPPATDWFDMATKQELQDVVSGAMLVEIAALRNSMLKPFLIRRDNGDPRTYVSIGNVTRRWIRSGHDLDVQRFLLALAQLDDTVHVMPAADVNAGVYGELVGPDGPAPK